MNIVALAGGVGAAKFLRGLVLAHPPADVTVIGNTGDDAVVHGLHVSPDLDIVTYTLAGLEGKQGWGFAKDTTAALEQLEILGAPSWFKLGDRDLGTHLARTTWLAEGASLGEITDRIRKALGVESKILPMSNERVRTKLITSEGIERDFQEYFVKMGHRENIRELRFEGSERARPAPGVIEAIQEAGRIIICPSNPLLSIGPIVAVPKIREALVARRKDVFAISPLVQGAALKGPADKLMPLWGAEASAAGVAWLYSGFCGNFILDRLDAAQAGSIRALGYEVFLADTVMTDAGVARSIAETIISPPSSPPEPAAATPADASAAGAGVADGPSSTEADPDGQPDRQVSFRQ